MGNESPIHSQCDQLHPEEENEVWQVKQEPDQRVHGCCCLCTLAVQSEDAQLQMDKSRLQVMTSNPVWGSFIFHVIYFCVNFAQFTLVQKKRPKSFIHQYALVYN